MTRSLPPAVLLLAACLALAACATRSRELGRAAVPELTLAIDQDGPWRDVPVDATRRALPGVPPTSDPAAAKRRPSPRPGHAPVAAAPARPSLQPLPRRTPPRPENAPPRTREEQARTRYLDHPTRIRAGRITFYCPASLRAEVRLTAADVHDSRPGRRVATGRARLLCRELTLEAEQIILRARPPGQEEIQISARGGATFVTAQGQQVIREDGAKSLLITNDQIVPLR